MIFPQPGIRTQQRSKGKYILTEQDILQCRKFDNGVAIGTWPVERWNTNGKLSMAYFETDNGYSIPADCLTSNTLANLFFAGKIYQQHREPLPVPGLWARACKQDMQRVNLQLIIRHYIKL